MVNHSSVDVHAVVKNTVQCTLPGHLQYTAPPPWAIVKQFLGFASGASDVIKSENCTEYWNTKIAMSLCLNLCVHFRQPTQKSNTVGRLRIND